MNEEKSHYRKVINWGPRLQREAPLLDDFLAACAEGPVLDLGCGSGDHAAWMADRGARVIGVDGSEAQIESARELLTPERSGLEFICCDFSELSTALSGPIGGAICLGNVLPFLEDEELKGLLRQLSALLAPGAPLLIQLLNYAGLRARGVRHLPVTVNPADAPGEELALLRVIRFEEDARHVLFFPTTLRLPAGPEEPELVQARGRRMRCWGAEELLALMSATGFGAVKLYGDVERRPYEPDESSDVVVWAVATG